MFAKNKQILIKTFCQKINKKPCILIDYRVPLLLIKSIYFTSSKSTSVTSSSSLEDLLELPAPGFGPA